MIILLNVLILLFMEVIMKASKKYYKDIKSIFPFHGKRERTFLKNLSTQINEYADDHNQCTYTELSNEFGTPIEILKSYYDSIDSEYLLGKMNNKTIINSFLYCIIIVLFIISLAFIVWL